MEDARQLAFELAKTLKARALYQGARRVRAPRADAPEPADTWEALRAEALACERCALCETRSTVVFGEGSEDAELMFVGEAPGRDEDAQGRPFVGRAGQLLTRMIENGLGMPRRDVFIANVLKCRPPNNRDPVADEVERCRPYLMRQIELVRPKVICTLGRHALVALTGCTEGITRVRGKPMRLGPWTVVPTLHPAYLLRYPPAKRDAWEDLKTVLRLLGRPVPEGKKAQG